MPRKGVPYGGAICSLKERIAELFDLVGEKLHSINGVQGDGQGNVQIESGDDAIVITNDQIGHKIELSLDNSKLPAAAVSSVNGKTGAVVLRARDIPSDGHSDVQADIDSSKTSITALAGDIIMERQARQKADAALQTNINRVQASIPEAAAHAVSNNPTVARLASDVPNKLDKITGGSIKRAYTHTGSVQDDTPAVNGTDADSIGLRDANGRMQAADPASGATDKTLVTANWVSQTGDTGPNNLVHRSGNERINNVKDYQEIKTTNVFRSNLITIGLKNKWIKVCTCSASIAYNHIFIVTSGKGSYPGFGILHLENDYSGAPKIYWVVRKYNNSINSDMHNADCVALTRNTGDNYYNIFVKGKNAMRLMTMASFNSYTAYDDVVMAKTIEEYDDLSNFDNVYYSQDYPY